MNFLRKNYFAAGAVESVAGAVVVASVVAGVASPPHEHPERTVRPRTAETRRVFFIEMRNLENKIVWIDYTRLFSLCKDF